MEPYMVSCPNRGLLIVYKEGRVWATAVARNASAVYIRRIRKAELDLCGREFEYPGGVTAAAERFLKPSLGIMKVEDSAKLELENIMKTYTRKSTAKTALAKIGDYALSKADEFIIKNAEGGFDLNDTGAEAYQYDCVVSGQTKVNQMKKAALGKQYAIVPGCDFSKRRGGFRATLDAVSEGNSTVDAIYAAVLLKMGAYKRADVYTDLSLGRKYGYIQDA